MKKKTPFIVTLAVFLCLSLLFCGLWLNEQKDHSELEQLCRYSASRSYSRFHDYQEFGQEYDYRYGISELVSFYNAYMSLVTADSGSTDSNCLYLNQLIGKLMHYPKLTDAQISQLVSITALLSEDICSERAYYEVSSLLHAMDE